jgi:hypothetical protein
MEDVMTVSFDKPVDTGYVFKQKGKYYVVTDVSKTHIPDDIEDSRFDDLAGGYLYNADCREATDAEATELKSKHDAEANRNSLLKEREDIFFKIWNTPSPSGSWVATNTLDLAGDIVCRNSQNGFKIASDKIWAYFREDGAPGRYISFDAAIAERLRVIDAAVKEGK